MVSTGESRLMMLSTRQWAWNDVLRLGVVAYQKRNYEEVLVAGCGRRWGKVGSFRGKLPRKWKDNYEKHANRMASVPTGVQMSSVQRSAWILLLRFSGIPWSLRPDWMAITWPRVLCGARQYICFVRPLAFPITLRWLEIGCGRQVAKQ